MPDGYGDYWSSGPWGDVHPEAAADAFAAAGVLSAARTFELGNLVDLVREPVTRRPPGSPLLTWQHPLADLLEEQGPYRLASTWRDAMGDLRRDDRRQANVRLWVKALRFREAAARLGKATAPADGRIVLSGAKPPWSGRPPPRWTWPLVVGIDTRLARMAELLIGPPAWMRDLVTYVDLSDPLMRCSLAVIPHDWAEDLIDPYGRTRAAAVLLSGIGDSRPEWPLPAYASPWLDRVAALAWVREDEPSLIIEIVRQLSHDLALDEALALAAGRKGTSYELYAEQPFLDRTRLLRMAQARLVERQPDREAAMYPDRFSILDEYLDQPYEEEGRDATGLADRLATYEGASADLEQRRLRAAVEPLVTLAQSVEPLVGLAQTVVPMTLSVWVGRMRESEEGAAVPFEEPEWVTDQVPLTVVLIPLMDSGPADRREIVLPRAGESTRAEFFVRASVDQPFEARIALMIDQRFVQTARLSVTTQAEITLSRDPGPADVERPARPGPGSTGCRAQPRRVRPTECRHSLGGRGVVRGALRARRDPGALPQKARASGRPSGPRGDRPGEDLRGDGGPTGQGGPDLERDAFRRTCASYHA